MKFPLFSLLTLLLILGCNNQPTNSNENIFIGNWKETYSNSKVYGDNDSLLRNYIVYTDTSSIQGYLKINNSNVFAYAVTDSCYYFKQGNYTFENGILLVSVDWNLPISLTKGVIKMGHNSFLSSDSIFFYDTTLYDTSSFYYGFGYRKSYGIVKYSKTQIELPNSNWPNQICN